jgi:hypothetical protein
VSTVQEIKNAIESLSPAERRELVAFLPTLFPELDGDAAWERLIHDARPRRALTALLDEVEQACQRDPNAFRETSDSEFDRHS